MNIPEAARFLQIPERRLRRWIKQGLLTATGSDDASFDRESLAAWARERGMRVATGAPALPVDPLCAALERGSALRDVSVANASEAIGRAVEAVQGLPDEARARILAETLERERMASTGLGDGVAVPHPRTPQPRLVRSPTVICTFLDPPLDWMGADPLPVHTAFLVLAPNAPSQLAILSRIARLARAPGVAEFLRTRPSRDALIAHAAEVLARV